MEKTVFFNGEEQKTKYANLFYLETGAFKFSVSPKVLELLCGKTFGENKNSYINCAEAEIKFMKILLGNNGKLNDRVYLGQPLYGYNDTDFTFTSRGLLHPVSLFDCVKFRKTGSSIDFVEDVLQNVSGTAFEYIGSDLLENYRTKCLQSWLSPQELAVQNATAPTIGGGRKSKKKRSRRTKRKNRKTRKSRSRR